MSYLAILRFYLHQRGIQALLVGGCLLGFGLGQTVSINAGTHAQHTNMASSGRAAAIVRSQAGGGLGDNVAGQQAVRLSSNAQILGQSAATSAANTATSAPNTGEAKHVKGHHKHKDGKGSGDQNHPKAKGHRKENSGGPHGGQGKGVDGSTQTKSGGDH